MSWAIWITGPPGSGKSSVARAAIPRFAEVQLSCPLDACRERELAKRMAERVQTNRQPITLEAMPPNERRIVHISLRDHLTVKTQSIGEGDHRRVMIIPK